MMRTLLGTGWALSKPDLFAWHRAVTDAQKRMVLEAYHADMRGRGLSPYNLFVPYQLDNPVQFLNLMEPFWTGSEYVLPAPMMAELALWPGHSMLAQHFGGTHYRRSNLAVFGVPVDAPDAIGRLAAIYARVEAVYYAAGVTPYVMFDEPNISTDAANTHALPLAQQPNGIRWVHRLTQAVRASEAITEAAGRESTLRVGPAMRASDIPFWRELDTPFSWYCVKNLGGPAAADPKDVRALTGDAEIAAYYTSAQFMRAEHADQIGGVFETVRKYGGSLVLLWTVFVDPTRPQDSCALYAKPPVGTGFDAGVYPIQPKMDLFVAALGAVGTVPGTLAERVEGLGLRVASLERRLTKAGL